MLVFFFAQAVQIAPENLCLGSWHCDKGDGVKSPCVFDITEDPAEDGCLFCGKPEKRK